jgi:hypothetical protein
MRRLRSVWTNRVRGFGQLRYRQVSDRAGRLSTQAARSPLMLTQVSDAWAVPRGLYNFFANASWASSCPTSVSPPNVSNVRILLTTGGLLQGPHVADQIRPGPNLRFASELARSAPPRIAPVSRQNSWCFDVVGTSLSDWIKNPGPRRRC